MKPTKTLITLLVVAVAATAVLFMRYSMAVLPVPSAATAPPATAAATTASKAPPPAEPLPSAPASRTTGWIMTESFALPPVSSQPDPGAARRGVWLDAASLVALASLLPGAEIVMALPEAAPVVGRVNLVQREADGIVRIGGAVVGSSGGSFSLAGRGAVAAGRILLPERSVAYEIFTEIDGRVVLQEKPLSAVICYPLPRPTNEPQAMSAPSGPLAIPPVLSSRPTSIAVLYLDFDGETVTDPDWNSGLTIVAAASPLTAEEITEVWQRVKEDYWPFNIDVTTDVNRYNSAPVRKRTRCIITPTSAWFGSAGGVAFRTSFARAGTLSFSSTIPCWVFNSGVVSAAESISHELGHTLGLNHDGDLSQPDGSTEREYYHGHGTAPMSWGAIMGSSYSRNIVQWSKGEYPNANNLEDDVAIIANATNGFGYVPDDAGNDRAHAASLNAPAGSVNQMGIITSAADVDFFVFNAAAGEISIAATPAPVSPNLDLLLELQDASGNVLTSANPDTALNASVTYAAAAGTYYLKLSGTGHGTVLGDGYSSYGSIGQYTITGTIVAAVAPVIVTQPASQTAQTGSSPTLVVSATGTAPLSYLWKKEGLAIAGATNASLVLVNVQPAAAGSYTVVVGNVAGSATSNAAMLTVAFPPPVITVQPASQIAMGGANVTFSVTASSSLPLTYQWALNGVPLAGATGSSLVLSGVSAANAGSYTAVVSNSSGSVTSTATALVIAPRGLANGSVRSLFDATSPALTASFTIEGSLAKQMLIRAVGPALAGLGVAGAMADPQLEITHATTGATVALNDDWGAATNAAQVPAVTASVGAVAFATGSKDAAIVASFPPGTYRVRASGVGGSTGVALVEIYDADATPRLVYLATRARVGPAGNILLQGFTVANLSTGRSYLVRALGPSLGVPGALADPQLSLYNGSTLVGANDNWSGDATLAGLAAAVGAMPLSSASSKDAVLNFSPTAAGPFTAQVSGAGGTAGLALLEIFEVDAQRWSTLPAAVVSPPENVTVSAGQPAMFGIVSVGSPAPTYQWRKNGVALIGATGTTYTLASAQAGDAGSYDVVVTNSGGSATSAPAVLVVNSTTDFATQAVVGAGYIAGGTVTITNTLTYAGTANSLGWDVTLPAGWSYASDAGSVGDVRPASGTTGILEWAWTTIPASPVSFTYTVYVPAGETAIRTLVASAIVRTPTILSLRAAPDPLTVSKASDIHAADTDRNFRLSLLELTRVIELYNTRNGTTRTGCYVVATATTEDGFAPEPTRTTATVTLTRYHSGDSDRDGRLSLVELTRVIELYNTRAGTVRTGLYHAVPPPEVTEDGFAPGP